MLYEVITELVVSRGAGETYRGRGLVWNAWWDLVRIPTTGGPATMVTKVTASADGSSGGAFNSIRSQIVSLCNAADAASPISTNGPVPVVLRGSVLGEAVL